MSAAASTLKRDSTTRAGASPLGVNLCTAVILSAAQDLFLPGERSCAQELERESLHFHEEIGTWYYALGCILGEQSGQLFPATSEEYARREADNRRVLEDEQARCQQKEYEMLLCKKIKIEVSQQGAEALEFMQAFFRRVKAGENPGFPRFKPRHQFFTLCYPAMYLEVQSNTITLPTGGGRRYGAKRNPNVEAHLTEQPPEHFHEVAVSRDARGNYYCSFVYDDVQQSKDDDEVHKRRKKRKQYPLRDEGVAAFDLGIKTLATGYTDQGRFYHIGGFKGYRWYKKKSRRYLHLSRVYKRVAEKKRRKQQDCLHKASHFIAGTLAERAVVIGDLSQRQMVLKKKEHETPKERRKRQIRNRLVYNDWGLYGFVQMLEYKCLRFGKELFIISERNTTKTCHVCKCKKDMPLWVRTYRCENCGLVMDRDDNSAVNIYERFLAGPPPYTSAI